MGNSGALVMFPDDGHPDLTAYVANVTGDLAATRSSSGTRSASGSTPKTGLSSGNGCMLRCAIPITTSRTTAPSSRVRVWIEPDAKK